MRYRRVLHGRAYDYTRVFALPTRYASETPSHFSASLLRNVRHTRSKPSPQSGQHPNVPPSQVRTDGVYMYSSGSSVTFAACCALFSPRSPPPPSVDNTKCHDRRCKKSKGGINEQSMKANERHEYVSESIITN